MSKKNIVLCFAAVFLILGIAFASALTASLGSPGVVIRGNVGDEITKYIIVKNVNNVPVNVTLSVSGNLTEEIELQEKSFILPANKDKNAYFTLDIDKSGTYESKINVGFMPVNGKGSGVGLHFEVVLVASGEGEAIDNESEGNENDGVQVDIGIESDTNPLTGSSIQNIDKKISGGVFAFLFTSIVLFILLIGLIFLIKKKNKKEKKGEIKGKRARTNE